MNNTLLTVNVVTYNHRPWIEKCLDSILEQKTDFGFIVRIFDDCSTDGTTDICKQYAEKYPGKVFFYPTEKNLGPRDNPLRSYQGITTPYYLYIEGDDYRIDKHGFQEQVDTLEKHPECSFCAAKTVNFRNNEFVDTHPLLREGKYSKEYVKNHPETLFFSNLLSRIVRIKCITYTEGYVDGYLTDSTQFYELIQQGEMFFIDKTLACYVETGAGTHSGAKIYNEIIHMFSLLDRYNKHSNEEFQFNLLFMFIIETRAMFYKNAFKNIQHDEEIKTNKIKHKKIEKKIEHLMKLITPPIFHHLCHFIRDYLRTLKKTKKEHSNDA